VFDEIVREFASLPLEDVAFVPLSALHGDNVVESSPNTPWFAGPPLLQYLEELQVAGDRNFDDLRFPVQWVIRPMTDEHHDYRAYAGQLASGVIRPGDEVVVLPSGRRTRVAALDTMGGELDEAFPPLSLSVRLEDDVDVSRGDMLVRAGDEPAQARELVATICWMSERPLEPRGRYRLKHTTRAVPARVEAIETRLDVNTMVEEPTELLSLNDIGRVRLRLGQPLFADPYERNRVTGSFILIDESTGDTAGAGMILSTSA
jgi:sulfate adenylyltransferase subunit 1 (EFTu-like GTPase family)